MTDQHDATPDGAVGARRTILTSYIAVRAPTTAADEPTSGHVLERLAPAPLDRLVLVAAQATELGRQAGELGLEFQATRPELLRSDALSRARRAGVRARAAASS